MDQKLNIDTAWNIIDWHCADCGQLITHETDSGWDAFVAPGKTQPLCKVCDAARLENFDGTKGEATEHGTL